MSAFELSPQARAWFARVAAAVRRAVRRLADLADRWAAAIRADVRRLAAALRRHQGKGRAAAQTGRSAPQTVNVTIVRAPSRIDPTVHADIIQRRTHRTRR